jgi:hypothetical protein
MNDLQQRFENFVKSLQLWVRQIIVEQKVLAVDPSDKPQKLIDQLVADARSSSVVSVGCDASLPALSTQERCVM